jgi:hypothetical protein
MINICKTAAVFLIAVAIAITIATLAGPAMAQAYAGAGAGTWTSGGGGQYVGGGVSTGTGGTQTFSLGSGTMYSMVSVSQDDVAKLQAEGVRVMTMPAGTTVYVTSQSGQPLNINTGQGQMPNMIVFGPGGFVGTGVWAGTGGVGVGVGGVGAGAGAGTGGVGVGVGGVGAGAGAGTGGVGVGVGTGGTGAGAIAGPGGSMQMYSFTGSAGQAYLITQQTGGTMDRVLVIFQ